MPLHQIIYTSHRQGPMTGLDLVALLDQSRVRNAGAGISGLLLHADGSFMQTIEGEPEAVRTLFESIKRDPRHGGIIVMCNEPIERRSFSDWSMAFREIAPDEADRIPGFKRFTAESTLEATPTDRDLARRIMQTFSASTGLHRED